MTIEYTVNNDDVNQWLRFQTHKVYAELLGGFMDRGKPYYVIFTIMNVQMHESGL